MDIKKHLEIAWNLTLKNIVPLILMTLVMLVVSFFTLGILAPVMLAGYMQSILLMVRNGREPSIGDIFSEMRLFLPLLGFGIVAFIAIMIGFTLFFLPGLALILALTFGCFYMLPLMTDRRMGLVDAIKESWQMAVKGNVADHVVVVILYVALVAIGSSIFIGSLFTLPFGTILLISVYLERMGTAGGTSAGSPPPIDSRA
jgi:membrane-anchored glycerophosphoryl diester phosphodiesterase (GDPDase)